MNHHSLFAAAALLASTAQAKELTFFFDVHSSGPEIYPCDAGMIQKDGDQFCHYKGTATTCSPSQIGRTAVEAGQTHLVSVLTGQTVAPDNPAHACICTGRNGGQYLMNFMRYKAAKWVGGALPDNANPNHLGWGPTEAGTIQGSQQGNTVARHLRGEAAAPATSTKQEFETQLESVTFNFGSELYGAHFFVDLCYRGPQLPYYLGDHSANNAIANFATEANITTTNPFLAGPDGSRHTLNYAKLSEVSLRWETACDLQGTGTYKFDHNGTSYNDSNAAFDTMLNDITDSGNMAVSEGYGHTIPSSNTWVGALGSKDTEPRFLHGANMNNSTLLSQNAQPLFTQQWITRGTPNVPRFCKLRYYFTEKPFSDRERAWQRADARFIVKWKVEETAAQ